MATVGRDAEKGEREMKPPPQNYCRKCLKPLHLGNKVRLCAGCFTLYHTWIKDMDRKVRTFERTMFERR